MIDNHPSYNGMKPPESCLQPVLVGEFDEHINNTDECKDDPIEIFVEVGVKPEVACDCLHSV